MSDEHLEVSMTERSKDKADKRSVPPGVMAEDWERERLLQLNKSRGGHLGHVTRRYNAFMESLHENEPASVLKRKLSDLIDAVSVFQTCNEECTSLAYKHDQAKIPVYAKDKAQVELQVQRAQWEFDDIMKMETAYKEKSEYPVRPFDSVSQVGSSVSSTSSARAKVAGKRAALQAKLSFLHQQERLEYEQLEVERQTRKAMLELENSVARQAKGANMRMKKLELESDIAAAAAEEKALSQYLEDVEVVPSVGEAHDSMGHQYPATNPMTSTVEPDRVKHKSDQDTALNLEEHQEQRKYGLNPNAAPWETPYQPQDVPKEVISPALTDQMRQVFRECLSEIRSTDTMGIQADPGGATSWGPAQANRQSRVDQGSSCQNMHSMDASFMESQLDIQRQLLDVMSLPKMSLMTFDGNAMNYSAFISAFDTCVDKVCVDDGVKLNRLLEYCKDKAAKLIRPCTLMKPKEGYIKARQLLKERFGNEFKITEAWVGKLTHGPSVKPNDGLGLQDLADDLRSCILSLKALNKIDEIDSRNQMVKVTERLPLYLQSRWRKVAVDMLETSKHYPNIEHLANFVERVAREVNDPVFGTFHSHAREAKGKPRVVRAKGSNFNIQAIPDNKSSEKPEKTSVSAEKKQFDKCDTEMKIRCHMCGDSHKLNTCRKFKTMSVGDRLDFAKKNQICFNCLERKRHIAQKCNKKSDCNIEGCSGKHSRLLHHAWQPAHNKSDESRSMSASGDRDHLHRDEASEVQSMATRSTSSDVGRVVLPIVPVWVRGSGQKEYVRTLALLDTGSNRTFCSLSLAKQLEITGKKVTLSLETINDGKESTAVEVALDVMGSVGKRKHRRVISLPQVYALDKFPNLKSSVVTHKDIEQFSHLKDVDFVQEEYNGVTLLIGQDVPSALQPLEVRSGSDSEPYAVRTALGWVLNGPIQASDTLGDAVCTFIQASNDDKLQAQVERFWNVDYAFSDEPEMSMDDKRVLKIWDTSARLKNGHYELKIPFRDDNPSLPNNKVLAEKRLQSLGRRLGREPALHEKYKTEINNLLDNDYAEAVSNDNDENPGKTWYLPHHNVVNPNKPDKFRVVFDCAARYRDISLNDAVLQGPDLMNNLVGILQKFRKYPYAIMSDIRAMFHQVRVEVSDRDVLRFLWWRDGDPKNEVLIYRMTVHLFGGVWSPSCAAYALRRTVEDNKDDYSSDVSETLEHFYVDDFLISFGNEDTAGRVLQQIGHLVQNGGFHLTKWLSNSRRVLSLVPPEERATLVQDNNLDLDSLPVERALGIYWDCERDELRIHIKPKEPVCTRRGVLSLMSSVYDPLGLVGPYIFLAKRIFQDECRLNKGWDEPLSEQNKRRWLKWVQDLDELTKFSIKRCLIDQDLTQINKIEFHHFCDASEAGYGVVSYLRIIDDDGNIHCSFLQAKSRLAPIKQITIPRLGLLGAVIAVKIDAFLHSQLRLDGVRSIFWTDSMIVLHYIRNTSKRFRTFVANRVNKIHEGSSPDQWRHVDTKSNPADDASRGLEAIEMVASSRWKQGPAFLHQNESMWPDIPDDFPGESEDKEILLSKSFSVQIVEDDFLDVFMKRYSDWFRLKKAVAWLLCFKSWLKAPQKNLVRTSIEVSDLEEAEVEIFKYVQRRHFTSDIHALEVDRMVPKGSKVYKLDSFIDARSVLRVGGRLKAAPIPDSAKHPIILPRDHHVSELIVRYSHEKQSLHSGREYVLSVIRQKYWILRVRPLINKVLHRCVTCARTRGILGKQHMADLPADRVTPNKPPFAHVGVDCFGPFLVKRGRSQEKRYGCLFTCLSIRAIHVEKLHSLESDSFINALVRFSARRGFPAKMRSDNGTNFTGAERELQIAVDNLNKSKNVQSYFLQKNIQWDFNPPAASHMGGVWEHQIRTTRKVLNSILKNQILDDERLDTFFCEAEAIVNGRPLTPVSNDPEDLTPLTPNHLLLLRGNTEVLPGPFSKNDAFGRRWRHVQYMADTFWTRWVREYLPILQERQKWNVRQKNLALGDIVFVVDETVPRKMWPLARVIDIYPGKDDLVRSVKLKTSSGTLVRPVAKLCHLEGATSA